MRIGAVLSPVPHWPAILEAARAADDAGLDAIGLYDHYHSAKPEWAYICGWSAYGALAASTKRVRLVPMILNGLHYEPGVLAKESSVLAILSGNRFELAIGAGDWPESFAAWGMEFPAAADRLDRLVETVAALRQLWAGTPVSTAGPHVQLDGAISTPAPKLAPRVVVGVGASRQVLRRAVLFADEVNVYDDPELIAEARTIADDAPRPVGLSAFLSWERDRWPADPERVLQALAEARVERAFVTIAAPNMTDRVERLGAMAQQLR
jgi:alkanesulfonate monooxygenase SsuD/methylene tetrahydromethanopterin reductase-like flavin-dependent oxidoreductase (luciferase family)